MARRPNEIYLENGLDVFTVTHFHNKKTFDCFDIEIYDIHQKVKFCKSEGHAFGIDFIFNGEIFYSYVSNMAYFDLPLLKERFEWHFKKQLNI